MGDRKFEGRRLARLLGAAAGVGGLLFALGLAVLFFAAARELPEVKHLSEYGVSGPYGAKQATVVYGKDGQVVARFASERRTVVPFDRIPKVMIDAVVSAEDAEFFTHTGLDYLGILRCAIKNSVSRRKVCGGSTITQQTVKTFLLSPEKTIVRKAREMILAKRVEEELTKEQILYLYLNQIYFGHGAYGIQEAARVYFGKDVERLGVEEAALLAGLPKSPHGIDPYRFPERARTRRAYVLGQMKKLEKIDGPTFERALASPIRIDWQSSERDLDSNNYYADQVKRQLEQIVGSKERVDNGGLKVYAAIDPAIQRAAEQAMHEGLRALDKRQGWRGPLLHLEADELKTLKELLEARRSTVAPSVGELADKPGAPVIFDLSYVNVKRSEGRVDLDRVAQEARYRRLELESIVGGLVTVVDEAGKSATVDLGGAKVELPLRTGLAWARKYNLNQLTRPPRSPSDVLSVGDIVLVKPTSLAAVEEHRPPSSKKKGRAAEPPPAAAEPGVVAAIGVLEQVPLAQAAAVVIDPNTRQVRALVGGSGVGAGNFNRATQAHRQAGSTFKPFVYATAFDRGEHDFRTISICHDAPRVYRDPWTGKAWKPENYDLRFDGEITLRTALTKSKNMCSVELIDKIGVDKVIEMARKAGIESELPQNLTLALGSGDVTPLEMVNAYATLATGGQRAEPIFIRKVVDPENNVLFEAKFEPKQTIAPETVYQITSLMQSVVEDGTARPVSTLGRPIAGKTGTSNEARNAWFIGFSPDLVGGVWVGFDDNEPLGPGETGGRAAIPIWISMMADGLAEFPARDFAVPATIVSTYVDAEGRMAPADATGVRLEPFVAGFEPTEFRTSAKPPVNFGKDDFEN
jgi:penicillin-binding protein 1A